MLGQHRLQGDALLEQEFSRLNPGIGVEAAHHGKVQEVIGQGDKAHALVVGHIAFDQAQARPHPLGVKSTAS